MVCPPTSAECDGVWRGPVASRATTGIGRAAPVVGVRGMIGVEAGGSRSGSRPMPSGPRDRWPGCTSAVGPTIGSSARPTTEDSAGGPGEAGSDERRGGDNGPVDGVGTGGGGVGPGVPLDVEFLGGCGGSDPESEPERPGHRRRGQGDARRRAGRGAPAGLGQLAEVVGGGRVADPRSEADGPGDDGVGGDVARGSGADPRLRPQQGRDDHGIGGGNWRGIGRVVVGRSRVADEGETDGPRGRHPSDDGGGERHRRRRWFAHEGSGEGVRTRRREAADPRDGDSTMAETDPLGRRRPGIRLRRPPTGPRRHLPTGRPG